MADGEDDDAEVKNEAYSLLDVVSPFLKALLRRADIQKAPNFLKTVFESSYGNNHLVDKLKAVPDQIRTLLS